MAEFLGGESSDPGRAGGSGGSDAEYIEEGGKCFVFVGGKREFMARRQIKLDVEGRTVALFHHKRQFYALDRHCYHAGGPLEQGDIEDVGGKLCVICPWHKMKITLETGEGLYLSIDPKDLKKPTKLCSKGEKQRVHHVKVEQDKVYIALSDSSVYRESDHYYQE